MIPSFNTSHLITRNIDTHIIINFYIQPLLFVLIFTLVTGGYLAVYAMASL